jgi:hypothetical protein
MTEFKYSYRNKITSDQIYCGVPVISPRTNKNYKEKYDFNEPKLNLSTTNSTNLNCQQQGPFISTGPEFFPRRPSSIFTTKNPTIFGSSYAFLRRNQPNNT